MNKVLPPMKAIRAYCRKCKKNSAQAIEECAEEKCPLHPYRFGKRPASAKKREYTADERAALRERMKKLHEARGQ